MGDRGCLSLFGDSPDPHRLSAEHATAEYRVKTEGRGQTVDEWKLRPERGDRKPKQAYGVDRTFPRFRPQSPLFAPLRNCSMPRRSAEWHPDILPLPLMCLLAARW
jgi:hypothetical protein